MKQKIKLIIKVIKLIENWPEYFLDYLNLLSASKTIKYKLRNGFTFIIRPSTDDRIIFNEVWIYGVYDLPGDDDIVVDIGAQIGMYSIYASNTAKKVYSFEPTYDNYKSLNRNIGINNIRNVVPIKKAVLSKSGKKEISINKDNCGSHSFIWNHTGGKETVNATTLKEFIEENHIKKINLLKIDCELSEYDILFNCPDEVFEKIDKIMLETHHMNEENNSETMKKFLEGKGYKITNHGNVKSFGYMVGVRDN